MGAHTLRRFHTRFAQWPMAGAGPLLALAYLAGNQLPFCILWDAAKGMTLREPLSHSQCTVAVGCPVSDTLLHLSFSISGLGMSPSSCNGEAGKSHP